MSMTSTTISKLAEVDPVFRQVISKLYPAVDPRELWDLSKAGPDQADVHVKGDGKKKALAAGLLFGTAAEGTATYRAAQHAFKSTPHRPSPLPKGSFKRLRAAHGGKAEFGLQAANMAIGLGAARELVKKPKRETIPKRYSGDEKAEFMELCAPIIKARREKVISTEKALEMIEEIEKGMIFNSSGGVHGMKNLNQALKYQREVTNPAISEQFRHGVNRDIHTGRKAVGAVVATTAATTGIRAGKKKEAKKLAAGAFIGKSEDEALSDYEFVGDISKMDEDKRQVFGWCSLTTVDGKPVVDLQNDYISIEEIEKSAYDYVRSSRKGGDMHARVGADPVHTSDMIESVIVTPEKLRKMGVPEESISKVHTGWWVGFQVNDDAQWQKVKSGERAGFSIHGKGARVEKMLDE
jgi:hypothetical protein